ncbi:MAG: hypothetical protein EXS36_12975 [Pedosphaera sp.]|nr:hypothetical protein [Pedosphaera sp.]
MLARLNWAVVLINSALITPLSLLAQRLQINRGASKTDVLSIVMKVGGMLLVITGAVILNLASNGH